MRLSSDEIQDISSSSESAVRGLSPDRGHPHGPHPQADQEIPEQYPNRRLYDTQTSVYITLADIRQLVLDGAHFQVVDARSQEDLTRSILLQIIVEGEAGPSPLFPQEMLAQMIRFHGHPMQGLMSTCLEKTLQAFIEVQAHAEAQHGGDTGGSLPDAMRWAQFMQDHAPVMQRMMSDYIEQSKNLFLGMQAQMQQQTRAALDGMPGGQATSSPAEAHGPDEQPTAPATAQGDYRSGRDASDPAG